MSSLFYAVEIYRQSPRSCFFSRLVSHIPSSWLAVFASMFAIQSHHKQAISQEIDKPDFAEVIRGQIPWIQGFSKE